MEPIKTEERRQFSSNQPNGYNQLQMELSQIKGKIEALKVYLDSETYPKKEVVLGMLGEPYVKSES